MSKLPFDPAPAGIHDVIFLNNLICHKNNWILLIITHSISFINTRMKKSF